ncbi:hypothetical protein HSX10_18455 [Winogradskyella undariae]|uniref:hypothetical protein n=1 Tax=Winogradskyella undariae TaxID=1285465 RepID=UPI00156BBA60|nr:hypothetical protein [Winogradskyella undariae]NRR93559.1 hypothetical protein [Winogradskyella undariae]
MNFIKKIFSKKKEDEKVNLKWNEHLNQISESIDNDELSYPIILFCHVPWDFEVYNNPSEIIRESISGHWGLNEYLSKNIDELEIVVDSCGKAYKLSHEHYDKKTKTGFSYPSKVVGVETIENLKKRIIDGCNDYLITFSESEKEILKAKMETVKNINSIPELIYFAEKELNF